MAIVLFFRLRVSALVVHIYEIFYNKFLRIKQAQNVKFIDSLYKWDSPLLHLHILPCFCVLSWVRGCKGRFLVMGEMWGEVWGD